LENSRLTEEFGRVVVVLRGVVTASTCIAVGVC
jgi:hypothetical protein